MTTYKKKNKKYNDRKTAAYNICKRLASNAGITIDEWIKSQEEEIENENNRA